MVAITEAITGQLYLISVVAIVVQGLMEHRRAGKRDDA
jgi:uncharacterized MnhB-related membrane protein